MGHTVLPAKKHHACLSFVSVHQMSTPQQLRQRTSNCSSLLIYRPRKDERLSWPGWLTYSGWFTHVSGHPSATGRAQDSESTSAKDRCSTAGPRGSFYGTRAVDGWAVALSTTKHMKLGISPIPIPCCNTRTNAHPSINSWCTDFVLSVSIWQTNVLSVSCRRDTDVRSLWCPRPLNDDNGVGYS